jgi:hypothetical protein
MLMHEVMFTCVEARRNAASVHESENERAKAAELGRAPFRSAAQLERRDRQEDPHDERVALGEERS